MQLSKNFTLQELCASQKAKEYNIFNHPAEDKIIVELTALCQQVLQPLRDWVGRPLAINSGYRCMMLNSLVGGSKDSQHTKGQAADINVANDRCIAEKMANFIQKECNFDQIIIEHDKSGNIWLHVSHRADGHNRRNVILNYEKK